MESTQSCLFCRVAAHLVPATIVYEDDEVVAFNDIHPNAPIHILIIPKKHIASVDDLQLDDQALIGHVILTAQHLAREKGIHTAGYRLVFNVRDHGGQVIDHIHMHLLGGKPLGTTESGAD